MIQYKCDMCEQEIKINDTVHVIKDFPRRVQYWITARNNIKIASYTKYEAVETHLCDGCFCRLADTLAVVK